MESVEENFVVILYCNEFNLNINIIGIIGFVKWYIFSGLEIMSLNKNYKLEDVDNYLNMKLIVNKVNNINKGIYKCIF